MAIPNNWYLNRYFVELSTEIELKMNQEIENKILLIFICRFTKPIHYSNANTFFNNGFCDN